MKKWRVVTETVTNTNDCGEVTGYSTREKDVFCDINKVKNTDSRQFNKKDIQERNRHERRYEKSDMTVEVEFDGSNLENNGGSAYNDYAAFVKRQTYNKFLNDMSKASSEEEMDVIVFNYNFRNGN